MNFSLLHPSRGRAKKSFETILLWMSRAGIPLSDMEILIGVEDYEAEEYLNQYFPCGDRTHSCIKFVPGKYGNAVKAVNELARLSVGRILIVVSDDSGVPPAWAVKLKAYTNGLTDFVMKVRDGIQANMITMPIMDRVYFQRDGYIYNPIYDHAWADREFTEVARIRKRVIEKNIMFRHNHYSITKHKIRDAQYQRTDATFNEGRAIFMRRKQINFGL